MLILQALAIGLDAPVDYFVESHKTYNNSMLLLHYPSLSSSLNPPPLRHGAHTDLGSITLLFQDQTGGLEVCTRSGEWIPVPPIANTPLVLLGNLVARWTNDQCPATQHRVSLPTVTHASQERYSFGFFAAPDDDAEVICLPSCIPPGEVPKYPPIRTQDYYEQLFQTKQQVKQKEKAKV